MAQNIRNAVTECITRVDDELRIVLREFNSTDTSELPDDVFVQRRDNLETRILHIEESQTKLLESLYVQLESLDTTGDVSTVDQLVAVEQRNVLLEEQLNADLQLAQLGMALEVISHEFNGTIRSLRTNLRKLKAWADANRDLDALYRNIRASFEHLDGYLTLFTPLQRRLYRKAVTIRGSEIHDFLQDLFANRFSRHDIVFLQTDAFARTQLEGYPSSFYPVFVNLVDNAVFWLAQQSSENKRRILLDAREGVLFVMDSGPGVTERDGDAIFEFGFTRKPGGRGMGLHISRETLRRVGYDLVLADPKPLNGAGFAIRPQHRPLDGKGPQ